MGPRAMVALQSTFPVPTLRQPVARPPRARRVAVVLNANARRVDAETLRWVRGLVAERDVFLSSTLSDSTRIAATLVAEGYDAVLWGGGDGTFANGVAEMAAAAERAGRGLPDMGCVRLGTGNAVADAIGASRANPRGVAEDLRRARVSPASRLLPMLDVERRPSLFCGFGLDAQILDDFGATVRALGRVGLARHVRSAAARYFLAVTSRSIPRFVAASRPEVVAINRGAPATRIDVHGHPVGNPIPAGRVLWRGVASLASASTIPFYGLGLRMFPHSERRPGQFQLRLSDAGSLEILANLPAIWKGRFASPRLHDFLVDDVEIVLSRPAPFQANGDLIGDRERARINLWHRSIPVV
jgi:diacylglycerol kinase family enzyme